MSKSRHSPQPAPWSIAKAGKTLRGAGRAGTNAAFLAGATAAPSGELISIATIAALGFAAGATANIAGVCINYWKDDPSPVFDDDTVFLFDMVGMIICFLLFVLPAYQLDLIVQPEGIWPGALTPLPGYFGFLALFLSIFLVTILRGLLVNLGLVRSEDDYEDQI